MLKWVCILLLWVPGVFAQSISEKAPRSWSWATLGLVPIQHAGRIKPLESFAREWVLFETGVRRYQNWEALDLLLSWIAFPDYWHEKAWMKVSHQDLREQLSLEGLYFSPRELLVNPILKNYATGISQGARKEKWDALLSQLQGFHSIVSGLSLTLIPGKPSWQSVGVASAEKKDSRAWNIQHQFFQVIQSYISEDQGAFQSHVSFLRQSIQSELKEDPLLSYRLRAEFFYEKAHLFLIAWVLHLVASGFWLLSRWQGASFYHPFACGCSGFAFFAQILGIAMRCFIAQRPPVSNMYESVIWVSSGIPLFAWSIYAKWARDSIVLIAGSFLAVLGLIASDIAPTVLDASIQPLVPVLRSNYWLTIHVLTITLSYAAFAVTLGIANCTLFQYVRGQRSQIASLNQWTYRAMQFGVVLIAAGTILGGIWADESWGRFWGWDPKEVWALITLLCYMVILHGRYAGWVGPFGFAVGSALSFLSVLMAWYGVNFVLGVGLHSYGFSSGGGFGVAVFIALELVYILGVAWFRRRHEVTDGR
jgi:cytochrome c-type biogenesis protein CcsB